MTTLRTAIDALRVCVEEGAGTVTFKGKKGVWRTTHGTHIFIPSDKSPAFIPKRGSDIALGGKARRKKIAKTAEKPEKVVFSEPAKQDVEAAKKKAASTKWQAPDLSFEAGEIKRTGNSLGIPARKLQAAAKNAKLAALSDSDWSELENTDSNDTTSVAKAVAKAKEYNRDITSVIKGLGGELPAPIVLKRKGEAPYLIAGNTRLMVSKAFGIKPKVLVIDLDDAGESP
jgi:hypothetical protein